MPESEPKPKLIELVAPGAGQGWKATLKNGKAAVIHEIPAPSAEALAAIPRIQRLAEHRHPALAPVLAWGTDPNGIWVAVEPNEGTPLGTILARGPLTPPAAAALGAAVLSGVSALHEAGIAMGGFGASAVRVTGNGEVRLSGHPAAAVRGAPSQSDLRADVRSCGMAICAAFGVDPAGAPAPPSIPPGLVVTMRSMASGAMGPAADRAQGALREMAAALLAPDRMTAAQSELALRSGGREMPSITPFLPKETFPPAPGGQQPPAPITPWGRPAPAPEEPPVRQSVSYEAPPRPMETYPPAAPPPMPPPPVPPPYVPPQRQDDRPGSYEPRPRAPEAFPTVPPIPAAAPAAPAPVPTWDAKPAPAAPPERPSAPTWDTALSTPAAPPAEPAPPTPSPPAPGASIWEVNPPPPPQASIPPPAAPVAPPAPAPPPAQEQRPTWTAIPTPRAELAEPEEPEEPSEPEPVVPAYIAPVPSPTTTRPPAPAAASPTTAVAPSAPARKPPAPRRPVRPDILRERPSWLMPAIAGAVVLLLIIIGTGIFLANRGNPGPTGGGPSPKASPKASPKVTPSPTGVTGPLAVPTYAPTTAAPITGVAFCHAGQCADPSSDTSCSVGGSCHVTVEIKFSAVQRGDVAYVLKFFDRCTGTTTDLPGNHFTPPGYITVDITAVTTTPSAKSAALTAVTTSPATAASAPLMLGGDSCA